ITQFSVSHGVATLSVLIIDDPVSYLSTSYTPPQNLYEDWEQDIQSLQQDNTMLVSKPFSIYYTAEGDTYTFRKVDADDVDFNIGGVFDYFPIIYDVGDLEEAQSYTYDLVMSKDNFLNIVDRFSIFGISLDRLLIEVQPLTDHIELSKEIEDDYGFDVHSSKEIADAALLQYFPFYSMIVAEFVFGVIICLAAIVFTSLSNPLKILQRRITKHDALKKIGISTRQIILVSAIELFIAAIVPGLMLGALAGYGLERAFNSILVELSYDILPYTLPFPYVLMLCMFIGIPLIFFGIYYISMKRNFAKYQPRNLE
ncbi:MAG: ABC transporter permease, partial [Candidatus Heimdallarchaeota archaeon]|nr:ABC transporter permease [Candidatus Heimdallarchaeota archaeon]